MPSIPILDLSSQEFRNPPLVLTPISTDRANFGKFVISKLKIMLGNEADSIYSDDGIIDNFLKKFYKNEDFFDKCICQIPTFNIISNYTGFYPILKTVLHCKENNESRIISKIKSAIARLKELKELDSHLLFFIEKCKSIRDCIGIRDCSNEDKEKKSQVSALIEDLESLKTKEDESARFLDANNLMVQTCNQKVGPNFLVADVMREWYIEQSIFKEFLDINIDSKTSTDPYICRCLATLTLQAYQKAANFNKKVAGEHSIQISPFSIPASYHRHSDNPFIVAANKYFSRYIFKNAGKYFSSFGRSNVNVINSSKFREVISRTLFPHYRQASSLEQLKDVLKTFLEDIIINEKDMQKLSIDISDCLSPKKIEIVQLLKKFNAIFSELIKEIEENNDETIGSKQEKLIRDHLHIIIITQQKGECLLIQAENEILVDGVPTTTRSITLGELSVTRYGAIPSPDRLKIACLKLHSLGDILSKFKLPTAKLTRSVSDVPQIFTDWGAFLEQPLLARFQEISTQESMVSHPYQQIMSDATIDLLKGLKEYDVHTVFAKHELQSLLQVCYIRLTNALRSAILYKKDFFAFQNEIEVIHQQIQTILTFVAPYNYEQAVEIFKTRTAKSFMKSILDHKDLTVHSNLRSSGMGAIATILSAVEAQKGHQKLGVALLKDSYYEIENIIKDAKTYQRYSFLNEQLISANHTKSPTEEDLTKSIDLFICEFHHNISIDRQIYVVENIQKQIKTLFDSDSAADKLTVMIDVTLCTEESVHLKSLFINCEIEKWLLQGRLNIVMVRSLQKFHMLGLDNYSGGLATAVHQKNAFTAFDERFNCNEECLKGLSLQGLTYIQKHGADHVAKYHLRTLNNAQKLYAGLPEKMIYKPGTINPIQVSQVKDSSIFFIDIKFPNYPHSRIAFRNKLPEFASEIKLPLVQRSSFGFGHGTITEIGKGKIELDKIQLDLTYRLCPGLCDKETIEIYWKFFTAIQEQIDTIEDVLKLPVDESIDQILAARISSMVVQVGQAV